MQYIKQALDYIKVMEEKATSLQAEIEGKEETLQRLRKSLKRVVFDEAVIAEHDKERGTRMKIDEPKTPYVRDEPFSFPDDSAVEEDIPILTNAFVEVPTASDLSLMGVADSDDTGPGKDEDMMSKPELDLRFSAALAGRTGELQRPQMLDLSKLNTTLETVHKKQDFENARSKHYNEYERLKQWRERHNKANSDDEEEEG